MKSDVYKSQPGTDPTQQFSSKFLLWVLSDNWDLSIGFAETQITSKMQVQPIWQILTLQVTNLPLGCAFLRT